MKKMIALALIGCMSFVLAGCMESNPPPGTSVQKTTVTHPDGSQSQSVDVHNDNP